MSTPDPVLKSFIDESLGALSAREPTIPFPSDEYRERLERLRRHMSDAGVETLLLTSPDAMCWLHGYRIRWNKDRSPTVWPPLQMTAVRADDDRYIVFEVDEHAELLRLTSVATDVRVYPEDSLGTELGFIVKELAGEGWLHGTVGIEKSSPIPNRSVGEMVEAALEREGATIVDATLLARHVRRVKSPLELAKIEEAAAICDAGLQALQKVLHPGITELEAWAEMVRAMAELGGEPAAIHECVVAGPIELGHAISSRRKIAQDECVFADPCGVVDRYHANVAKTFWLGEPPPEALRIAEIEAGAFDVLCSAAKAGVPIRDVNRELREYYIESGTWGMHAWTGGYELGISFPPDWVGEFVFTVNDEEPDGFFEAGMVTNFESIVHYPMIDTIVYEETGARTLSRLPHEIAVVG